MRPITSSPFGARATKSYGILFYQGSSRHEAVYYLITCKLAFQRYFEAALKLKSCCPKTVEFLFHWRSPLTRFACHMSSPPWAFWLATPSSFVSFTTPSSTKSAFLYSLYVSSTATSGGQGKSCKQPAISPPPFQRKGQWRKLVRG
jgi:hypothetical protein